MPFPSCILSWRNIAVLCLLLLLAWPQTVHAQCSGTNAATFRFKFGTRGAGDGELYNSIGVVVNAAGQIIVADSLNHRIVVFDANGNFVRKFGQLGSGDGEFNQPFDVAVNAAGDIFVADAENDRIQVFDANGNFLRKFGTTGNGDGEMDAPLGIAVNAAGNVIVADNRNRRIQIFDASGNFLSKFGQSGTGDGEFNDMTGLAVNGAGEIVTIENGNRRVQVFDASGNFLRKFGKSGTGDGEFGFVIGIEATSTGNIIVTDSENHRIQVFDANGNFLFKFGQMGMVNNSEFYYPEGVAVNAAGNIIIVDTGNHRVQVFNGCPTNAAPTIAANSLVAIPGTPAQSRQIATVSDSNQTANTLTLTINGGTSATVNGVTVSNPSINPAGQVTAQVSAIAGATQASFTLKVTDNGGLMNTDTLTINPIPIRAGISDPAVCLEPGGLIGHEATLTNPNNLALAATLTATLPAGLTAVPGSCLANVPGTCSVAANGGSVTWSGTLSANTTVSMVYRTRVAANTANGTQFCIDNAGNLGGILVNLQFCFTLNCPVVVNTRVSDQKAGSVLVFPYYTSTIGGGSDTRITISNISNAAGTVANQTYVHLFLIDGTTCNQADLFLCLTPNASFSFKASEYDPGNTGYVLAVAVNNQGIPIQNNVLVGNAFVRTNDFADNYGAESFAANSFAVATVSGNAATLYFDQVGYDAVPKQFAVEIQSPVDVVGQQVVTAGMSGDLTTSTMSGAAQVGTGQAYNEKEAFGSFNTWLTGTCQARGTIAANSPRVPNGLNNLIKTGQAGSLKFNVGGAVGLLMTPRTATWRGIRTLHKTQTTATTITIPVIIPVC